MRNCVDIVRPFADALQDTGNLDSVQLIGGLAAAALRNPDTKFDAPDHALIAPADGLYLPQYRPNGSLSDVDILVLSPNTARITAIENLATQYIGDELKISVFGLHHALELDGMIAEPFSKGPYWMSLSDRYVDRPAEAGQEPSLQKAIFPFSAPIPNECMESWRLEIDDDLVLPIAHPGTAILNYATRSLAGLRAKDAEKVDKSATNVLAAMPEMKEWLLNGPGQSQIALAGIFWALGSWRKSAKPLQITEDLTINPPKLTDLATLPEFMLSDSPEEVQDRVLKHTRLKARLLGIYERNERLVAFWQRHNLEDRDLVSSIVKNR